MNKFIAFILLVSCFCHYMPNVCVQQELAMIGHRQPCVQAFARMVKVWKQGCTGQRWCMGYERRTSYYTAYRQVYAMDRHTVYKCCPGWTRKDNELGCLHRKSLCSAGTCFNGGQCTSGDSQVCQCPEGFQGSRCQYGKKYVTRVFPFVSYVDVDECAIVNGGCQQACINTAESFHCECDVGYRLHTDGRTCIIKDLCSDRNGGCAHICKNEEAGTVSCECRHGYRLSADRRNCEDIDECRLGTAMCAHRCVNMLGSFRCTCNPGFELGADGKQCYRIEMEIVNSCEKDNGGCSHRCEHSTAGPLCSCNQGFHIGVDSKTCVDTDECETGEACCSQFCKNYPGGYECSCKAGFILNPDGCGCDALYDDFDEEEEEELEVIQLPGLRFRKPPQFIHYSAALHSPYDYENEEEIRGEHTLVHKISKSHAYPRSFCLDNSFGNDCSLTCEDCINGGVCNEKGNGCDCPAGWTGSICNESKQGEKLSHPGGAQSCPKGLFGKSCNRKCNCANNGHCHRLYGACLCDPGLYGRFCHLSCPRWTFGAGCSEECLCVQENTLHCDAKNGSCICKSGYHGDKCQKDRPLPNQRASV
uniref:EGF-like and EMI domain containing 1 n=1 Tax=Erpetoichthys calabaricus TaxID=27687 RepID=A0A8C4SQ62_ERPCA